MEKVRGRGERCKDESCSTFQLMNDGKSLILFVFVCVVCVAELLQFSVAFFIPDQSDSLVDAFFVFVLGGMNFEWNQLKRKMLVG